MMDEAEATRGADAERFLDARGIACPLPVLKARKHLAGMSPGERLRVEATDPMAAIDLPHLCQEDGHLLLAQERFEEAGRMILRFVIERGARAPQPD